MRISHRTAQTPETAQAAPILATCHETALTPARNTNVGAQKWVIQRVANRRGRLKDPLLHPAPKRSFYVVAHVIESHDNDPPRPRTMSIDVMRYAR